MEPNHNGYLDSGVIVEEVQKDCISKRITEVAMRLYLLGISEDKAIKSQQLGFQNLNLYNDDIR